MNKFVEAAFKRAMDPLDHGAKVGLITVLLNKLSPVIPELADADPER